MIPLDAKVQEILDAGPPQEPDLADNPGNHVSSMYDLFAKYKEDFGDEPNAYELVLGLAHVLDMRDWQEECNAIESIKRSCNWQKNSGAPLLSTVDQSRGVEDKVESILRHD